MFSKQETELLSLILRSNVQSLHYACESYLNSTYGKHCVFVTEDFIYATGDIPILLVAHLDTVFIDPPKIYSNVEGTVWRSKAGLGADDRAGVFAVLQLVKKNKSKPSVLFTMDEELGGLGAMAFVKQFPEPPVPTKYVIEIDRRGKGQSVYYDCGNAKFEEYINSFGFTTHQGIFSDISFICPTWNVAGVNLSAGYQNEHTELETLDLEALAYTKIRVSAMLSKAEEAPYFDFEAKPTSFNRTRYVECGICGSLVSDLYTIPVENVECCYHCINQFVDWCDNCGEPFFVKQEGQKLCEVCANESIS